MKRVYGLISFVLIVLFVSSTSYSWSFGEKEKVKGLEAGSGWSLFGKTKTEKTETKTNSSLKGFVPPESFHGLVEQVAPAVVNISTTKKAQPSPHGMYRRRGPSDPFDDFFEKFFEGMPGAPREQHSLGSGFIIDKDGMILTNNHVVARSQEIVVTLSDERKYKAKLIGRDAETDLAIIKIQNNGSLPHVELGDSDHLEIGDWVLAIGNPFGLSQTVTAGIVSAKGRVIGAGPYDNFIQTDASINPGNSGGPLFDMNGKVVGINTAIFAGGQGLGFAIPISMAKKLLPQLIAHGKVTDRGWLGVMIQSITPDLAKSFGLPEDQRGALIGDVLPNTPAEKAGLKRGDIIVEFNNHKVVKSTDLPRIVATTSPDTSVPVLVIRDGKELAVNVVLGKKDQTEDGEVVAKESDAKVDILGLVVKGVTQFESHKLGIPFGKGVVVENVEPQSSAADVDVQVGDVIFEINSKPVNSLGDYSKATSELKKGDIVRILIGRQGATTYLAFTLK